MSPETARDEDSVRRPVRAVLLLDETEQVASWTHEALRAAIDDGLEIVQVAHCLNTPARTISRTNLAYYGLAFVSRRKLTATSSTSIDDLVGPGVPRIRFHADHEGMWQRIPDSVSSTFAEAEVLLKFGMTLLRGADDLPFPAGVLSYHHGDPEQYRGRPAGFYELLDGQRVQGVIVQRLSDTLDGGEVLAKAYSQVVPYSYARTIQGAYLAGIPLLTNAIRAIRSGDRPPASSALGPNYRLPRTGVVLRQAWGLARKKVLRATYGATREKRWQIGRVRWDLDPHVDAVIPSDRLRPVALPKGYVFAADPCADGKESFFAELMNGRTGRGEIARWSDGEWRFSQLGHSGHASYPFLVEENGDRYLFPEVSSTSPPTLFPIDESGESRGEGLTLQGLEMSRLVDATLFPSGGHWFLFAGNARSAGYQLELWMSSSLRGPYVPHPSSPICIDPRGARMAGPIARIGTSVYRFGQDGSQSYGGSVRIHRIDEIDAVSYSESISGSLRLSGHRGPHTVNVQDGELLIDYFSERSTPFAGIRRVRALVYGRLHQ